MAATPATILNAGAKLRANQNGPDHRLQINQHLLYERDFYGETFVSAHLQRLQNGVFTDSNIHKDDTLHVTFTAITFLFHPYNSDSHRFKSAVISIKVTDQKGEPLRFLKYAPHVAYGRISSANLKWNFQLGASLGVTNGLVDAKVTPSISYEKDAVVGSFMKMQGSTRCAPITKDSSFRKRDTMLVWSLEENTQQGGGIPSEFTFVFLVERPHSSSEHEKKDDDSHSLASGSTLDEVKKVLTADRNQSYNRLTGTPHASQGSEGRSNNHSSFLGLHSLDKGKLSNISSSSFVKPILRTFSSKPDRVRPFTAGTLNGNGEGEKIEISEKLRRHRVCNFFLGHAHHKSLRSNSLPAADPMQIQTSNNFKTSLLEPLPPSVQTAQELEGLGQDGVHEMKEILEEEVISQLPLNIQEQANHQPFKYAEDPADTQPLHDDYNRIFTPIRISISVKPNITNAPDKATNPFVHEFEDAIIEGQVGQKFPTNRYDAVLTPHTAMMFQDVMVDGLFNFAQMPGNFEDMIELPGNAVTTVEPVLSSAAK